MATMEQLQAVEQAARRLLNEGLRTTPDGMIVRESKDRSDPHYALCVALDAIEPLNLRRPVQPQKGLPRRESGQPS